MSEETKPVAWITAESMRSLKRGGNSSRWTVPVHAERSSVANIPIYAAPPSAAAIRAMALQEAAKAAISLYRDKAQHLPSYDEGWNDACDAAEQAIRALSPAPSVTEEWVEQRKNEAYNKTRGPDECDVLAETVRATLAALGIEVRK